VDLGAPDVGASTVFYGAVLGWEFVDTGEGFGHYHIGQVDGHAAAAIGPKQDPNQPTAWTVTWPAATRPPPAAAPCSVSRWIPRSGGWRS
jgi:catechol 2,3-dioxygenase-like lactoylglutathione lyase family enzyme